LTGAGAGRLGAETGGSTRRGALGRIQPNHLDILPPQSAYMGFWGVFDLSFWRSPPLLHFSDYM
jgi:hypothetical protein